MNPTYQRRPAQPPASPPPPPAMAARAAAALLALAAAAPAAALLPASARYCIVGAGPSGLQLGQFMLHRELARAVGAWVGAVGVPAQHAGWAVCVLLRCNCATSIRIVCVIDAVAV